MTQCILVFLALVFTLPTLAQRDYKGRVIDAETGYAVPYVNIGIVSLGVGTVSDEDGIFHLYLESEITKTDPVVIFTSLGYKPLRIPISQMELVLNEYPEIRFFPAPIELREVVVTNSNPNMEFVDEAVGYKEYQGSSFGYWKEEIALGAELASRIRVKKGN